jgi:hypothetical protein
VARKLYAAAFVGTDVRCTLTLYDADPHLR